MINAKLEIAIIEAIERHAAAYRQSVIDLEETLSALRRVSSALLGNIPDPDERAAMLNVLVDEPQRAAQGQSSERDQGQLRAEDVRSSSLSDWGLPDGVRPVVSAARRMQQRLP